MFNYIRSEFYKLFRRKYIWIMLIILLLGEILLVGSMVYASRYNEAVNFYTALSEVSLMVSVGFYASLFSADIVFAGQYKNGTLKNEVSFGLSRTRIYLGKLLSQTLLSLLVLVVAMVSYIGMCWFLLPHTSRWLLAFQELGGTLLGALPIWIGMQAVICASLFLLRNGVAAEFTAIGLYTLPSLLIQIITMISSNSPMSSVLLKIYPWLPDVALGHSSAVTVRINQAPILELNVENLANSFIVGGFWLILATATGLYFFRKKEIK